MSDEVDLNAKTKKLESEVSQLSNVTWLVVVVLFIGFGAAFIAVGGMIVNAQASAQSETRQMNIELQKLLIKLQEVNK